MLSKVDFKPVYATGENEPAEFFLDGLMNSHSLDLGLGYFSSSGFRALSIGFAFFIKRGGIIRMTINNVLSEEDKQAMLEGQLRDPKVFFEQSIVDDILKLKDTLSRKDIHFFKCLSWLIATKKLEIKATIPKKNKIGIVHQKFGLFKDDSRNIVAFTGSLNFSESALLHNVEALWCDFSWSKASVSKERIGYFSTLFDETWSGKSDIVEIIPLERVNSALTDLYPVDDLNELIHEEIDLGKAEIQTGKSGSYTSKVLDLVNSVRESEPEIKKNKFPSLRPYQLQATQSWVDNNYRGLFEMATGTGKTITALNCANEILKKDNNLNLIILVPTLSLATQWMEETKRFLSRNVIIANSENDRWYSEAQSVIHQSKPKASFCIVTTYATFLTDRFQALMSKTSTDTVLIADEVHNFGTSKHIPKFPAHIKRRLGLSATPDRYFDETGTAAVLKYFGAEHGPTFRYGMAEAIANGYLCEYYYHPIIVELNHEELEEYKAISRRLLRYFVPGSGFPDTPIVTALLLRRKRIIHKAQGKFAAFRKILSTLTENRKDIRYVLVYVPEGNDDSIDSEDQKLINAYSRVVSEEYRLTQHQFIGITSNRDGVLDDFAKGKIAVLTAMKCLDEGVDVKRAEIAIFCSSTGNPRQFIQRRGRILRTHPEKKFAVIYDMIVVPALTNQYFEDSLQMEKGILQSELRRVREFANLSLNHYQALQVLESVTKQFDLDIFSSES